MKMFKLNCCVWASGPSPFGKGNPMNRTKERCLLGNTGSHRHWLIHPYYHLQVRSLTTHNSRLVSPQMSLIILIFTFPLGLSFHYLSLTGQQPPSWSIQIHTGPLPIHVCMVARVTHLHSKPGHVTPCLMKPSRTPVLLQGLLHMA